MTIARNTEPIHILGAGSMGLLLAASIRAVFPSYPIGVLLRPTSQYATANSQKGMLQVCLEQQDQQGRRRMRIIPVPSQVIHCGDNNNKKQQMIHNLVVTTKAFQAVQAVKSIRHRLTFRKDDMHHHENGNINNNSTTTSRIIILCNGAMAVRDELLSSIPELQPSDIHLAITTHGAYREISQTHGSNKEKSQHGNANDDEKDNNMVHLIHAGVGRMDIPTSLQQDFWQPLLNSANLNVHVQTSAAMQRQLWCKLAANCVINPLTAIHQCTNGQLLQRIPNAQEILLDIVKEVAVVARAVQASAANNNEIHHDNDEEISNDLSVETLEAYCHQVIHDTKNNKSSMLQDVLAQRRTEVDYLNGHVVAMGRRHGNIDCPVNADLCQQIQDLTANFT